MTPDPPPPGSPWAARCPDAFPAEWFDALRLSALPTGFSRFADANETALITGEITPDEFDARTGRVMRRKPPSSIPVSKPTAAPNGRFAVLNGFVDAEMRNLTRAEIAVWLVLYRDTKPDGTVRTGQADLARRSGCTPRTVRRAISRLATRGLVTVLRQGRPPDGPSCYRIRGTGLKPPGSGHRRPGVADIS